MKRKNIVARNAKFLHGVETRGAMTKITTVDATGTEGIAVDLSTIITTATRARV